MNAKELLADTAKFFETNPDKFITEALAQNRFGYAVPPTSPHAVCFCAVGYMGRLLNTNDAYNDVDDILEPLDLDSVRIYETNDQKGREAVIALLKETLNEAA